VEDTDKAAILQARNEELEKHIETLKKELGDLKSMQNNYMMQMQTLINQKAIKLQEQKTLMEILVVRPQFIRSNKMQERIFY